MLKKIAVSTKTRCEMVDITQRVGAIAQESGVKSGLCQIFVPHTTAGITINENADPSVRRDMVNGLERVVPSGGDYEHSEGNAAAHIKSSIIGTDKNVFIDNGELVLGTWQGIFFCEFDGPRQRSVLVRITEE